jgi:glycosyltransferase involved in cell wall biosynthesis
MKNNTHPLTLSIIVPVYNSAETLGNLIERLESALADYTIEVILVNDGSRDLSWKIISQLSARYKWVHGINLMRNFGQHNALLCGIRAAQNEIIVTIDDDLQNPPEEIPKLLSRLSEEIDVVYGTPLQQQHGLWRDLASLISKLVLQHAMSAETARNVSAFRVFRTFIRDAFVNYNGSFVSIDVLLTWGTTQFASIRIVHHQRQHGVSNYTIWKLITHAINMMTGFSTIPLQIASLIGFFFTLFGIGVLIFVILRFFTQGDVAPGFPFLASIIAIFSGAQLLALGIIGEYIARMYFRMMDRPSYTVREQLLGSLSKKNESRTHSIQ